MSTWILENKKICLKVDNTGGGVSIRSLYDKENDYEWVYTQKEGLSAGGIYDSGYNGGFEFMFPTDEPCRIGRLEYQDHGFLWTTPFETLGIETEENERHIAFKGKIQEININVRIEFSMKDESRTVYSVITFENENEAPVPYLFRLHPSIRLNEESRLDLNGEDVEFEFNESKVKACDFEEIKEIRFPYIHHERGVMDFRDLGNCDVKEIFCHIKQESGSFEIEENNRKMLVAYDHCKLPILTLYFFNNGQKVVILEPATSSGSNVSKFPDEKKNLLYDRDTYAFDFTIV